MPGAVLERNRHRKNSAAPARATKSRESDVAVALLVGREDVMIGDDHDPARVRQTLASRPNCSWKMPMVPGPQMSWVMRISTEHQTFCPGTTCDLPACAHRPVRPVPRRRRDAGRPRRRGGGHPVLPVDPVDLLDRGCRRGGAKAVLVPALRHARPRLHAFADASGPAPPPARPWWSPWTWWSRASVTATSTTA